MKYIWPWTERLAFCSALWVAGCGDFPFAFHLHDGDGPPHGGHAHLDAGPESDGSAPDGSFDAAPDAPHSPDAAAGDGEAPDALPDAGYVCGDGVRAPELLPCSPRPDSGSLVCPVEECDDGNLWPADGCSATCRLEPGWTCPAAGGACVLGVCGDRKLNSLEGCDDGNTQAGDGCDQQCQIEPGSLCCSDGFCRPMAGSSCDQAVSFGPIPENGSLTRDVQGPSSQWFVVTVPAGDVINIQAKVPETYEFTLSFERQACASGLSNSISSGPDNSASSGFANLANDTGVDQSLRFALSPRTQLIYDCSAPRTTDNYQVVVSRSPMIVRPKPAWSGISALTVDPQGRHLLMSYRAMSALVELDLLAGTARVIKEAAAIVRARTPFYGQFPYLALGTPIVTDETWDLQGLQVDWSSRTGYAIGNVAQLADAVWRTHFPQVPDAAVVKIALDAATTATLARGLAPCALMTGCSATGGDIALDTVGRRVVAAVVSQMGTSVLHVISMLDGSDTTLDAQIGRTLGLSGKHSGLSLDLTNNRVLTALVTSSGQRTPIAIDLSTGVETLVSPAPARGSEFAIANGAVVENDLDTGAQRIVSSDTVGSGPVLGALDALVFDPSAARILVAGALGVTAVDPSSGMRTRVIDASMLVLSP